MAVTQGEAVFQAVRDVFPQEVVPPSTEWSSSQKEAVYGAVFRMFKDGYTSHRGNPDDAALLKYIPGLVNNWVRKDKRLNGGAKYLPKNPGSRTGSGDEVLRNLKALLATQKDPEVRAEIQLHIDERMGALKPKPEINVDALPAALRHLVVKQ
jgi:hypothetical protein